MARGKSASNIAGALRLGGTAEVHCLVAAMVAPLLHFGTKLLVNLAFTPLLRPDGFLVPLHLESFVGVDKEKQLVCRFPI